MSKNNKYIQFNKFSKMELAQRYKTAIEILKNKPTKQDITKLLSFEMVNIKIIIIYYNF
jgi:hypothetical protein